MKLTADQTLQKTSELEAIATDTFQKQKREMRIKKKRSEAH